MVLKTTQLTDFIKILPKLRFPEFTNDGDWKVVKLGEIISIINPHKKIQSCDYRKKGLYPIIDQSQNYICGYTDNNEGLLNEGNDFLIVFGDHTCILKSVDFPFVQGADGIKIFRSKMIDCVVTNFIYHFLLSRPIAASEYKRHFSELKEIDIVFPHSLLEQQKIASFLTSLDDQISAQKQKLEALKAHKKSLMQQLFPANGEKTPKLRFPEFKNAGEWDVVELGKISDVYSGGTPNVGIPDYYNGSIPFIRSGEIKESHTKLFISQNGLVNSSAKMVAKGDILYALYGATSGEVAISQIDGAINQAILAIIPHNSIDKYLICQILAHKKSEITNRYLQGGQGNLSAQIIKSVTVSIPKYKEQQKIASFLSSIDDMIQAQDNIIQTLKKYKNGLTQQMFPHNN